MGSREYLTRAEAALAGTVPLPCRAPLVRRAGPGQALGRAGRRRPRSRIGAGDEPEPLPGDLHRPLVARARVRDTGDTYPEQVQESADLVAARPASTAGRWPGRAPGARPSPGSAPTSVTWCADGWPTGRRESTASWCCPIGFVTDHLEVLYDLDVELAAVAPEVGPAPRPHRLAQRRSTLHRRPGRRGQRRRSASGLKRPCDVWWSSAAASVGWPRPGSYGWRRWPRGRADADAMPPAWSCWSRRPGWAVRSTACRSAVASSTRVPTAFSGAGPRHSTSAARSAWATHWSRSPMVAPACGPAAGCAPCPRAWRWASRSASGRRPDRASSGCAATSPWPATRWPPRPDVRGPIGDRSIGPLVSRKLGRRVADRLVDPLIGGIHAGSVDDMSAAATYPPLLAAAQKRGSLMRALRAEIPVPSDDPPPLFWAVEAAWRLWSNDCAPRSSLVVWRSAAVRRSIASSDWNPSGAARRAGT